MIAESVLVDQLEEELIERKLCVEKEVPLLSKRIDIIGFDKDTEIVIAVEVKVRDWKRAFRQALRYKLCSDETYVALYNKYIESIDLNKFRKNGIGLISISDDGEIDFILEPKKNEDYHKSLRKKIINYLNKSRGGLYKHG